MKEKLLKLLDKKGNLPSFPDILMKLQKKLTDPEVNIKDIAKLIEMDPALTGNILRLANSAFYTNMQEIKSLPSAISKLGLNKIKQFTYSLELSKLFVEDKGVDYFQFWKHSIAVALFTQSLSRYTKSLSTKVQDVAYFSGLMHDVGVMIFAYLIPEEYSEFLEKIKDIEEPMHIQEMNYFGMDHQEIGALFIEKWWKVDYDIVRAVRFHHRPFQGEEDEKKSAQLVNVANGICNNQGLTHGISCIRDSFKEGAWEALGLCLSQVDNILEDVKNSIAQAMEMLGYSAKG